MGLEGLNWIIPALTILIAGCAGFLIAVRCWVKIATDADARSEKALPRSLTAFTASVCANFSACGTLVFRDALSLRDYILEFETVHVIIIVGLVTSIVLLLAALFQTRTESGFTSSIIKRGSIALLSINGVGLILFAIAEYSI